MSELLIIWIMSVRSSLFALFLTERHRSQNEGSLKSEELLSDFKERCAQLCYIDSAAVICDLFGRTHFQPNYGLLFTQNVVFTAVLIILSKV